MNRILPGVYVGNYRDSKDLSQLEKHHITHILAITESPKRFFNDREYLCISASDNPMQNLTQYFQTCNDFVHNARLNGLNGMGNGNVLIHCLAGMSRSVTIAAAYLITIIDGLKWSDALKVVRAARPVSNPNQGFVKQLQEFEDTRLPEEKKRLSEKFPQRSAALYESDREHCRKALIFFEKQYNKRDVYILACSGLENNFIHQNQHGKYGGSMRAKSALPSSNSRSSQSSSQILKESPVKVPPHTTNIRRPTSTPSIRSFSNSSSPSSSPSRHPNPNTTPVSGSSTIHSRHSHSSTSQGIHHQQQNHKMSSKYVTSSSPLRQSTQSLPTSSPQHIVHHNLNNNTMRTTTIGQQNHGVSPKNHGFSPQNHGVSMVSPLKSSRLTHSQSLSHSQSSITSPTSTPVKNWERHYGCWKNHLNKSKISSNPILYKSNTSLKSSDSLTSLNSLNFSPQKQSNHGSNYHNNSMIYSSPVHNSISNIRDSSQQIKSCPNSPTPGRRKLSSSSLGGGSGSPGSSLRHVKGSPMNRSSSIREEELNDTDLDNDDEQLIVYTNNEAILSSNISSTTSRHHKHLSRSQIIPTSSYYSSTSTSSNLISSSYHSGTSISNGRKLPGTGTGSGRNSYNSSTCQSPSRSLDRHKKKLPTPPTSTSTSTRVASSIANSTANSIQTSSSSNSPSRGFLPTQLTQFRTRWVMKRSYFKGSFS